MRRLIFAEFAPRAENGNVAFKVTMSFGFGVGDFIKALELAKEVRTRFVDAPDQFKAISGE
jgi:hypothetical protein